MPSSRPAPSARRQMFLKISGLIEGQLRDAYDRKFRAGELNQSSLAAKLGVNRSAVHHRLAGRTNMTIETIADMIWGLGQDIELKIFEPLESQKNSCIAPNTPAQIISPILSANAATKTIATASSTSAKKLAFVPLAAAGS
jgi:hypothetical protein